MDVQTLLRLDADLKDFVDLRIPLGDAPTPDHGGKPCPPGIAAIKLSIAETARLAHLATQYTTGLISRARLAFALRWSRRRRPTRPPPTGTTTTPGSSPQPYPDSQQQPKGGDAT